MRIAVQGCCHGELDRIYDTILNIQKKHGLKTDLLLICGDFQTIRNESDLSVMACPPKFKLLGTFYKYYSGERVAPVPTIFVGGNHEASNYLMELFHGGWVAPNIYYLGTAGVINFGPLRIGGVSGIYKPQHYEYGFFERQPLNEPDSRTIYHVRKYTIQKLSLIRRPIDIFLSHDWPRGIAFHGNTRKLTEEKVFLAQDIHSGQLGSPPSEMLLKKLKPSYWFAAHLHVKFAALYKHRQPELEENPEEIVLDDTINDEDDQNGESESTKKLDISEKKSDIRKPKYTKFLSLDKCIPHRDFLQIIDVPTEKDDQGPYDFKYDEEWLAIIRATDKFLTFDRRQKEMPVSDDLLRAVDEEIKWVQENVKTLNIPLEFRETAPCWDEKKKETIDYLTPHVNPQTVSLCNLISLPNKINANGIVTSNPAIEFKTITDYSKYDIPKSKKIEECDRVEESDLVEENDQSKDKGDEMNVNEEDVTKHEHDDHQDENEEEYHEEVRSLNGSEHTDNDLSSSELPLV
ncbi:lariat debranching enzyme [Nowakowskiella sp. JEL0078]|nr:lariat debranching enzyme [Nowakowskiella sp. JEL0078]